MVGELEETSAEVSGSVSQGVPTGWLVAIGAAVVVGGVAWLGGRGPNEAIPPAEAEPGAAAELAAPDEPELRVDTSSPEPLLVECRRPVGLRAGGNPHAARTEQIAFLPDGRLRSYGLDGRVVTMNVTSAQGAAVEGAGGVGSTGAAGPSPIGSVSYAAEPFSLLIAAEPPLLSPDGQYVAVVRQRGANTEVVELEPGRRVADLGANVELARMHFTADGRALYWVDQSEVVSRPLAVHRLDLATGTVTDTALEPSPGQIEASPLAFTPNGDRLVAAGQWTGTPQSWESETGAYLRLPAPVSVLGGVRPGGEPGELPAWRGWLAAGPSSIDVGVGMAGELFNLASGAVLNDRFGVGPVQAVANSASGPDGAGDWLLIADEEQIVVWDNAADRRMASVDKPEAVIALAAFAAEPSAYASDGVAPPIGLVAAADAFGAVWTWALTPEPVALGQTNGHGGTAAAIVVSNGATEMLTIGQHDRRVVRWMQSPDGNLARVEGWIPDTDGSILSLKEGDTIFSGDGTRAVQLDDDGLLLFNADGRTLADERLLPMLADHVAIDQDGDRLAVLVAMADRSYRLRLLDGDGNSIGIAPAGTANALAVSPDGNTVALLLADEARFYCAPDS